MGSPHVETQREWRQSVTRALRLLCKQSTLCSHKNLLPALISTAGCDIGMSRTAACRLMSSGVKKGGALELLRRVRQRGSRGLKPAPSWIASVSLHDGDARDLPRLAALRIHFHGQAGAGAGVTPHRR